MTLPSTYIKWKQTFKRNGIVYKGAAVAIYLSDTTTAAPVFDVGEVQRNDAPQCYTDQTGYVEFSLNPDDFVAGQLFSITCTPNSVCSDSDIISLPSLMLLDDTESGRRYKQFFAQDSPPTKDADNLREEDIWVDTNDFNHLHRFDGTSWVSMRDGSIAIIGYADSTFGETWESEARLNYWDATGDGELSIVSGSGVTGGSYLSVGNNSGNDQAILVFNNNIPYDRTRRYRTHIRVKQTAGTGTVYCGFAGVAADGETWVNKDGADLLTNQHYHCCANVSPGGTWVEYEGITAGVAATGTIVAGTTANPGKMHEDVAYIRPLILVNSSDQAGTTLIDMMLVENFGFTTSTTFTVPDAPTNLSSSSSTYVSAEGQTLAKLTIYADPPSDNFEYLEFAYQQSGSDPDDYLYPWRKGSYNSGTGKWYADFYGLTPGLNHYRAARSVNPANANDGTNDYQHSTIVEADAGVMPGDTSGPSAPTGLSANSLLGGVQLKWTPPSNSDLSYQIIYRHTTNVFGSASELTRVGGRESKEFHDRTASYSTNYYYWVKGYDLSGNPGSVSTSAQASSGANQAGNSDISGMNFDKIGNGTLTGQTLTIGSGSLLSINGGSVSIYGSEGVSIKSGGAIKIDAGGQIYCNAGAINITSTGSLVMDAGAMTLSGGTLTLSGAAVSISASTLTISSTGQLVISNTTGIQINSGGGVNISTGGGITLNFTAAATAQIYLDGGALGDLKISGSSTTQLSPPYTNHPTLNLHSVTDGLGYLNIGGPATSNRWYYILLAATNTVSIKAGSTYSISVQTNGVYLNGGLVYYDSNWETYSNGTTSLQTRYNGTWKFSVTSDGDAYVVRDCLPAGVYNDLGSNSLKWWDGYITNLYYDTQTDFSSERSKCNIVDLDETGILEKLCAVKMRRYDKKRDIGVLGNEIIATDLVGFLIEDKEVIDLLGEHRIKKDDSGLPIGYDFTSYVKLLHVGLQEAESRIQLLEGRIN